MGTTRKVVYHETTANTSALYIFLQYVKICSGLERAFFEKERVMAHSSSYHNVTAWEKIDHHGDVIRYRPISATDATRLSHFYSQLSSESISLRWFNEVSKRNLTKKDRLVFECANTAMRFALVAVHNDQIVAIAHTCRASPFSATYELGFIVRDDMQGYGIGTELLRGMINIHTTLHGNTGRTIFLAETKAENAGMLHLLARFGFAPAPCITKHTIVGILVVAN
jgi:RimJ/RimL family protein N-acetyltransferase